MKLYADTAARRTRQVLADAITLAWCALWVWAAVRLHELLLLLARPGEAMVDAGTRLSGSLGETADRLAGVPVVGEEVRAPVDDAARAADRLREAGLQQQSAAGDLALFLAIAVAALPILLALLVWLPRRVRFVRRASAAQRLLGRDRDLDLFALRALATQPMHVLARIDADPADAWRRRDPDVLRALAALELRADGLRPPT